MALSALPDDILVLVLGYVACLSEENVAEWAGRLSCLWVCSRWRRLALPLAARRAVLVRGDAWTSNVPLIVGASCAGRVREVAVVVPRAADPAQTLADMACMLLPGSQSWTRVRSLRIAGSRTQEIPALQARASLAAEPAVSRAADALAGAMASRWPRLQRLDASAADCDGVCGLLAQRLATALSPRLELFAGHSTMLAHAAGMSSRLASLSVDFDAHSNALLPRIDAGALRVLSLAAVPDDTIWTALARGADSVRFCCLERLRLAYSTRSGAPSAGGPQLHFPRLRKLVVKNCPAGSPLLSARTSAGALTYVSITDDTGKLEPGRLVCGDVDALEVTSYSHNTRGDEFCHIANRLFGDKCRAKRSSLTLGFSAAVPDPELVQWSRLGRLSLFASVRSDTLLRLVAKMPRLVELVLGENVTHSQPEFDGLAAAHPAPISTSMRAFYHYDTAPPPGIVDLLKHLLLRVPSMAEFAFAEKHADELFAFVRSSAPSHPHILRVRYNLLQ
ncbi:hypothetical protein H4R18_002383 [Coemansia javaensis]|uniref:F-box domain-containing protein n=1 Tax=Coemansia javaensis TaxID=2761396 RepID=A0A9W8H9T5_9FUNG|nr:hypothetical protein H4R18_002383 [Coemansia javaensis]